MHTRFTALRRTGRSFGLVTVGVLSTLGALSLSHVGPASAQSPGVNLAQLVAQVNALQSKLTSDEGTITNQGSTITSLQSKLTTDEATINSQGNTIKSLQSSVSNVQSKQVTDENSIGKLRTLTASFSLSSDPSAGGANTLLTITGVNVQIVNGQGSTETANGLGNLIVGYNEARGRGDDARTGSHNIVTGFYNNFSSFGGLIGGFGNNLNGPEAFVVGKINTVSGSQSSIGGGAYNRASADSAAVFGGYGNTASGIDSVVSGGFGNTASGYFASVSGGINLTQDAYCGWSAGNYYSP